MQYHLAQINVAKFKLPVDHPANADFVANLDRVNAVAEAQPGFVWRLVGEGNSAVDVRAFDDPNVIVNMSVWTTLDALANFVYRTDAHRDIMRRRREWFDKMQVHLALWWIPVGHVPSVAEGKQRLELLERVGPGSDAFLFGRPFPAPGESAIAPVIDRCA